MTPEVFMRRRVNTAFLLMLLTLAVQTVAVMPSTFLAALNTFLKVEIPSYYVNFVLPQFLYPILTCALALIVLRCIRMPVGQMVSFRPLKADFIPWLGVFLLTSVVMNYAVEGMMWFLEKTGVVIPDVFESFDPESPTQAVCYFVVIALLPPLCEEILCRVAVTGLLKHFHPWTAVMVSAYAFGLMHGNLPQIPFAFVLGIVLGMVYVKTGNLLYPILFHFANNAWACILTFIGIWAGEDAANWWGYGADILFAVYGIASIIYLLVRKEFTLREIPHSLTAGPAAGAVVKSHFFWIFTVAYGGVTLLTMLLEALNLEQFLLQ